MEPHKDCEQNWYVSLWNLRDNNDIILQTKSAWIDMITILAGKWYLWYIGTNNNPYSIVFLTRYSMPGVSTQNRSNNHQWLIWPFSPRIIFSDLALWRHYSSTGVVTRTRGTVTLTSCSSTVLVCAPFGVYCIIDINMLQIKFVSISATPDFINGCHRKSLKGVLF